jgi:uncharacterized protein (DUF697 family)
LGTFRVIGKGAGALRPFVNAVKGVDKNVHDGGAVAVLDGEPEATHRLREILGVAVDEPLRDGTGMLVHAAVPGHDPTLAAAVLAGAKRQGRTVLVIAVGPPGQRTEIEHAFTEVQPLEPSNVAGVNSLSDPKPVLMAVARVLGDQAIAAGRRYPALREAVADMLVGRAARQSGAIGVVVVIPKADMPAITLIQVRLVAQLAALHGRPLDARRGLEVAGILASAFGWRAVARRGVQTMPVAGFAVRGGVAYTATLAVGEAARAYFAQAGSRADQPLESLQKALKRVMPKRGRS